MTVTEFLDARADEMLQFCAHLVQQPSPNPPGDTRPVAAAVQELLDRHGVSMATVAAREEKPNLVATIEGDGPGPHLVLNGHMDVYPAGDEALWTRPPLSGEVADGRLHGRGDGSRVPRRVRAGLLDQVRGERRDLVRAGVDEVGDGHCGGSVCCRA